VTWWTMCFFIRHVSCVPSDLTCQWRWKSDLTINDV
jgi:hypothetical protein